MIENNLKLISDRWPDVLSAIESAEKEMSNYTFEIDDSGSVRAVVVNGLHLSSIFEPKLEAQTIVGQLDDIPSSVNLYGFANFEVIRELLSYDQLTTLNVYILNNCIANKLLSQFDMAELLADPRLDLKYPEENASIQGPFLAIPVCLQLPDHATRKLTDRLLLELSTPYIRRKFKDNRELYLRNIEQNLDFIRQDAGFEILTNSIAGKKIVVTGAGPTLTDSYKLIKNNRSELFVISVDTTLCPLLAENIIPDVVVCVDGGDWALQLFECANQSLSDTYLVYFPIVNPGVIASWPGKRLLAYPDHELYEDISKKFPRKRLFVSGSVIHAAVDLGVRLGGGTIYLAGADFSYPKNQTHVSGSYYSEENKREAAKIYVENGYGEMVSSAPNLRAFLLDLESYISRQSNVTFINTSRKGAKIEGTVYQAVDGQPK